MTSEHLHAPLTSAQALNRRAFLNRAFLTTGVAAFAAMGGTALLSGASAQEAMPSAMPTGGPGGTPPSGGPGGTSQTLDAFKGITTDGTVRTGLFDATRTTGVDTSAVRTAVSDYLASLSDAQRTASLFPIPPASVETDESRLWSNVDGYSRQGVQLQDLTAAQKTLALAILDAALSDDGVDLADNIRKLNTTAGELANNTAQFNEDRYYFTFLGTPSATDPWGFQFEGHHLVFNWFNLGDQVVMTPTFLGTEPRTAPAGRTYAGLTEFEPELAAGIAMINSLTSAQQAKAIVSSSKTGDNNVAEAFGDNTVVAYQGIPASELTSAQQSQLFDLVQMFVLEDEGHRAVRMAEIKSQVAETYFSWVGGTASDSVFYFRVQSPVVLLQFDCQLPGPIGQAQGIQGVTRNHIHSIIRTPNGNDYGKDLLAQHLAESHGGVVVTSSASKVVYGTEVDLTGTTSAATAVDICTRKRGATAFTKVGSVTSDAAGAFTFPLTVVDDVRYYAVAGTTTSAAGLVQVAPSIDGAASRVVKKGSTVTLSGTGVPGTVVTLSFHRAGTAASDYSTVRSVTVSSTGTWSRPFKADVDHRFYATGVTKVRSGTVLVQAR
ncbi:MAG: hypothetical protein JWM64_1209 [Frankiales bacterium]|nr:hypothetical protein [Frankiales bacterium]